MHSPQWFQQHLADGSAEGRLIAEVIGRALNTDSSFDATRDALLRWADWGRWDASLFRAVEKLFTALASSMQYGEFRLFVEMDQGDTVGWAGRDIARTALGRWRSGEQGEAA